MSRRLQVPGLVSRAYPSVMMAVMAISLVAATPLQKNASKRKSSQTLEGKIVSVEKKGRTIILSVEDQDGKLTEHRLTTKTPVQISGPADSGFLRPGAVVYTEAFEKVVKNKQKRNQQNRNQQNRNPLFRFQQNLLFGKSFKVYLDGSQKRGWKKGKSNEIREVIGQVLQKTDKELTLDMGRAGRAIVKLEAGYTVNIVASDPDLIRKGAKVQMHGKAARGRFKATLVEIKLEEPLDSKAYFESKSETKKRGRKKRVATKKRSRSRDKKSRTEKKQQGKKTSDDTEKNPFAEIDKKEKKNADPKSKK